jgi:hypothetical protein
MRITRLLALGFLFAGAAHAYPPAPSHTLYGMVRTDQGAPLAAGQGIVIVYRGTQEVARGFTDPLIGPGLNYDVNVPMDAGILPGLYQPDAVTPGTAYSIKVIIDNVAYVPIQMATPGTHRMGEPAGSTRLDLSLGIDTDGDGLSDAWERSLIAADLTGRLKTLADITPGGDIDGDGLTNLQEQALGASPNNANDGLKLEVIELVGNSAHVRFVGVKGRTYGIKSSTDLIAWAPINFSLTAGGTTAPTFLAVETKPIDLYVPLGTALSFNLKLCVQ